MRHDNRPPAPFVAALLAPLLIAGHAPALHAATLGEARALSALGEPLRVRIDLLLEAGERADAVKARVASPSPVAGSMSPDGSGLTASVVAIGTGKAGVMVRSAAPVYRPYVELVVSIRSPAGRSDRSFVVALPPVRVGIATPGPAQAAARSTGPAAAPPPATAVTTAPTPAAAAPAQGVPPQPAPVATQVPVGPPQRQALEPAAPAPAPAAQSPRSESNRAARAAAARGERWHPPADAPNADGSLVISAIGDYATVTGEGSTPGAAQSRTYRVVTPEEESAAQAAPPPAQAWEAAPAPLPQAPAGVADAPAEAASAAARGRKQGRPAEMPPQVAVQIAAAPATAPVTPAIDEPAAPSPAGAAQPAGAPGPENEAPAAAHAVRTAPAMQSPAAPPGAASGSATWTYLEMGLSLLVLVLAGAVAYLVLKRKVG